MSAAAIATLLAAPFVGSFIALLSVRLPADEPWVAGRSRCRACGTTLAVADLVPLLSYLALRGRCRACGARIARRYPLIEAAALAVAALAAWVHAGQPLTVAGAALGWALMAIAIIDAEHLIIPDTLSLPLIAAGLVVAALLPGVVWWPHLLAAAGGFVAFVVLAWAYRRLRGRDGLGDGDARLFAAAGAWLGPAGLHTVLLVATVTAVLYALWLAARGTALTGGTALPFGPFLALGLWVAWLFGPLTWGI